MAQRVLLVTKSLVNEIPIVFVRNMSKHYNPKFKWLRGKKVIDPDVDFYKRQVVEDIIQMRRERGLKPPRYCGNIPFYIASTSEVFDPYVPQEGDGKFTIALNTAVRDIKNIKARSNNFYHSKKIKQYDGDFNQKDFAFIAHDVYVKAHEALASNNLDELEKYATEYALRTMLINSKCKTLRWQFIESLDPPQTVHVRVANLLDKNNLFAQVTVRFHSKQKLAIYDRFGRLMYGSEILAKDVLEYVVLEKHIVNTYGQWKLHHKIIPDWGPPQTPLPKTYRQVSEPTEDEEYEEEFNFKAAVLNEAEDKNT